MTKPTRKIQCPNCLKYQADEGKGQTCYYCGMSPLPSYSYNKGTVFYPSKIISQEKRIEMEIKRRRKGK